MKTSSVNASAGSGQRRRRYVWFVLLALMCAAPVAGQTSGPWVGEIGERQYFAVMVSDVDRSAAWYTQAFGLAELDRWTADDSTARIINLTSERLFIELIWVAGSPEVDRDLGFHKVGFWVPDVDIVADRVEAATGARPRAIDFPDHELRLIQIRDPDGNTVQIAEALAGSAPEEGASLTPRLLAVSVRDLDASVAWYRDVFGFSTAARHDFPDDEMRLAFMERSGFELELIEIAGTPPFDAPNPDNPATRRGLVKVAFTSDAIGSLYRQAVDAGARVQSTLSPSRRTGGRFFIVLDPDGNWVQVYESPD